MFGNRRTPLNVYIEKVTKCLHIKKNTHKRKQHAKNEMNSNKYTILDTLPWPEWTNLILNARSFLSHSGGTNRCITYYSEVILKVQASNTIITGSTVFLCCFLRIYRLIICNLTLLIGSFTPGLKYIFMTIVQKSFQYGESRFKILHTGFIHRR